MRLQEEDNQSNENLHFCRQLFLAFVSSRKKKSARRTELANNKRNQEPAPRTGNLQRKVQLLVLHGRHWAFPRRHLRLQMQHVPRVLQKLRGNSLQEFTSHGTHKRGLIFQDMMRCAKIARFKSQRHVYVSFNLYFYKVWWLFKRWYFRMKIWTDMYK